MSDKSLEMGEQALRLALVVLALAMAVGIGSARLDPARPRPGLVQEW